MRTNEMESPNYSLRRALKNRGSFPNAESIQNILYVGVPIASKNWNRPIRDWKAAINQPYLNANDSSAKSMD